MAEGDLLCLVPLMYLYRYCVQAAKPRTVHCLAVLELTSTPCASREPYANKALEQICAILNANRYVPRTIPRADSQTTGSH